ncbi:hypothetical protein VUR80DRAFT_5013 [Thermomyces stellatus]
MRVKETYTRFSVLHSKCVLNNVSNCCGCAFDYSRHPVSLFVCSLGIRGWRPLSPLQSHMPVTWLRHSSSMWRCIRIRCAALWWESPAAPRLGQFHGVTVISHYLGIPQPRYPFHPRVRKPYLSSSDNLLPPPSFPSCTRSSSLSRPPDFDLP